MNDLKIRNYAKLIAVVGANIQKGQEATIIANIETASFVEILVEELYKAGASYVDVQWSNNKIAILTNNLAEFDKISHINEIERARHEHNIKVHPARIWIDSDDPHSLDGIDLDRRNKALSIRGKEIRALRDQYDDECQWCIAGVPSLRWAKSVFPNLSDEEAMEKLWEYILKTSRAYEGDPIKNWEIHDKNLVNHMDLLNELNLKSLHYTSQNGTDLYIELLDNVIWEAGGENTKTKNIRFQPNIPTEECFTSPNKFKTHGIVYSTKPLNYNGILIEDFSIRFEEGKAVEVKAKKGEEALKQMLKLDENACYLGECALVGYHSPINDLNTIFFSTLYDENASCHLAFGDAFLNLVKGYQNMSKEELDKLPLNKSIVHTDFMIGSKDLSIVGTNKEGKEIQIFKDGDWCI